VAWLPRRWAAWLGRRLGDLAFLVVSSRRRVARANLDRALPDITAADRQRICRASFQHLGLMFVELCTALSRPLERTLEGITVDGLHHLRTAVGTRGSALVLTAHLGNWELLTVAHRLVGVPLSVVVRPLDAPWLDAVADRLRRKAGVELIDKRGALRPVLGALSRGRLVGILMDQNAARREGIFVSFFGQPASTSRSIAVLALRTRTPVVPIFIYREDLGRHRVVIHPALPVDGNGDEGDAVAQLTQRCTTSIEEAVGRAPEQWLWLHNRWRTRPPSECRVAP
jgi:Kdo2-lipid IVA lauroyltransferase/acyltransferase